MSDKLIDEVVEQLRTMSDALQEEVLIYTRHLNQTRRTGVHGSELVQFAGAIASEDLEIMRGAIEDDCRQVDLSEW